MKLCTGTGLVMRHALGVSPGVANSDLFGLQKNGETIDVNKHGNGIGLTAEERCSRKNVIPSFRCRSPSNSKLLVLVGKEAYVCKTFIRAIASRRPA